MVAWKTVVLCGLPLGWSFVDGIYTWTPSFPGSAPPGWREAAHNSLSHNSMWGDLHVSFCLETSDPTFKFESRSWPDSPEAVGGFGLTLVQGDPSLTLSLFLPRHCWQSKPTLRAPGSGPQHPRFSRSPERRVRHRDQAARAPWGSGTSGSPGRGEASQLEPGVEVTTGGSLALPQEPNSWPQDTPLTNKRTLQ